MRSVLEVGAVLAAILGLPLLWLQIHQSQLQSDTTNAQAQEQISLMRADLELQSNSDYTNRKLDLLRVLYLRQDSCPDSDALCDPVDDYRGDCAGHARVCPPLSIPRLRKEALIALIALERANHRDANLQGLSMLGLQLPDLDLDRLDMSFCAAAQESFVRTSLRGTDLGSCSLQNAFFIGANLEHAVLELARADGASFGAANLTDAALNLGSFVGANFSNATLTGASAVSANFKNAIFSRANLRGFRTYSCAPRVDVPGPPPAAFFEGARWSDTTCPDGANSSTTLSRSCADHLLPSNWREVCASELRIRESAEH